MRSAPDRSERVPKLMREHGEELILATMLIRESLGLPDDLLLQHHSSGDVANVTLCNKAIPFEINIADEFHVRRAPVLPLNGQVVIANIAIRLKLLEHGLVGIGIFK